MLTGGLERSYSRDVTHVSSAIDPARSQAGRTLRKVSPFLEHFARFGFAAKGITYLIMGLLAALAPIGIGTRPTGAGGALATLLRQPVGWLLLGIVAVGLLAFGVWQLVCAIDDPEHYGDDARGIGRRIGQAGSAAVQFVLVAIAIAMIIGWRRAAGDEDHQVRDWTAWLMSYPFGRWIVAAIGAGIVIYGIAQMGFGISGRLDPRLMLREMSAGARAWTIAISRFGVTARGVVFALIGLFLLLAAWDANAHEARGLGGTLRTVASQPYGKWMLAITALGLIAYGLYDFVLARYRRITPP
jgi:hypothetical protein